MNAKLILAARFLFLLFLGLEMRGADEFQKETVVYKQAGSLEIKADVYFYADTQLHPVLVSLHGGALIMGHRGNLSKEIKNFALSNKYALVSFDYRLAPETKLPAIIEDIEDAFVWLGGEGAKRFLLDPNRI